MPLPTIDKVQRCSVRGTNVNGTSWVNVVHMRWLGTGQGTSQNEVDALHAILVRLWSGAAFGTGAPWLSHCKSGTLLNDITYYPLDGTGLGIIKVVNAAATGGTGAQLPPQTAAVLTLNTAFRGRRYRGRIYFPTPLAANCDTNGNWTQALMDSTIAQWTGMQAALPGASWEPVVASYGKSWINDPNDPHDKILSQWTPFATKIDNATMDGKPDVQRRRK